MSEHEPSYECPVCGEWVQILLTTTNKDDFNCPWCGERLRLSVDAEYRDGMWRDLSKLVTFRSHWDEQNSTQSWPKFGEDWR